jgi:hypothetical protein
MTHHDDHGVSIRKLIDRAIEDGKLTRDEHLQILAAVGDDGVIDEAEQTQLDRLLKLIDGEVVCVVD